jgi:hypothetical protein
MSPFLAVGGPFVVLGVVLLVVPIAQRMRSAEAWGNIVAITTAYQCVAAVAIPPVNTATDLPIVAFKTEAGQHVTTKLTHGAVAPCMIGRYVRLRYDCHMPDRIWVPTRLDWLIPTGVVALGFLCILISIADLR